MAGQRVIVVGAGMLGAQAAFRLQSAGAEVVVIDAQGAGGAATPASFGWINASYYLDDHHLALRCEGMSAWHRLMADLPLPVVRSGALSWELEGDALDAERFNLTERGYAVEAVDAARFAALAPAVGPVPERGLWYPEEMAAESGTVTQILLQAAVAQGARIVSGVPVTALQAQGGRITGVATDLGTLTGDAVVLCAGVQTERLLAPLGIALPLVPRPALVLRTAPLDPFLSPILVSPEGEIRQLPDGSLLMPATVGHQGDSAERVLSTVEEAISAAMARLQAVFPDVPLQIAETRMAYRPFPVDGLPVLGQAAEGLTVAVMHSGITLGALVGELLATEVLQGPSNDSTRWLAPYRPDRFAEPA